MIKLVYDLRVGFDDCYLTIKNQEWSLADALEVFVESEEYKGVPEIKYIPEKDFYDEYKDDISGLLKYLEAIGIMDMLYEDSVLTISKLYFSHRLGGIPIKHVVPIWEPTNWKLVHKQDSSVLSEYLEAFEAKEVCDLLKLTKQQLYYYVKTGKIRKEVNPKNDKQFKYNRTDVYVLQKKLEKKYERYS